MGGAEPSGAKGSKGGSASFSGDAPREASCGIGRPPLAEAKDAFGGEGAAEIQCPAEFRKLRGANWGGACLPSSGTPAKRKAFGFLVLLLSSAWPRVTRAFKKSLSQQPGETAQPRKGHLPGKQKSPLRKPAQRRAVFARPLGARFLATIPSSGRVSSPAWLCSAAAAGGPTWSSLPLGINASRSEEEGEEEENRPVRSPPEPPRQRRFPFSWDRPRFSSGRLNATESGVAPLLSHPSSWSASPAVRSGLSSRLGASVLLGAHLSSARDVAGPRLSLSLSLPPTDQSRPLKGNKTFSSLPVSRSYKGGTARTLERRP